MTGMSVILTMSFCSRGGHACRLGRVQVQTRISIIDSLSPPFVIGLDVLRHCRCDVSFKDQVGGGFPHPLWLLWAKQAPPCNRAVPVL